MLLFMLLLFAHVTNCNSTAKISASHDRKPRPQATTVSHVRKPRPQATSASHDRKPRPQATTASGTARAIALHATCSSLPKDVESPPQRWLSRKLSPCTCLHAHVSMHMSPCTCLHAHVSMHMSVCMQALKYIPARRRELFSQFLRRVPAPSSCAQPLHSASTPIRSQDVWPESCSGFVSIPTQAASPRGRNQKTRKFSLHALAV
jgi:hypothetical protein